MNILFPETAGLLLNSGEFTSSEGWILGAAKGYLNKVMLIYVGTVSAWLRH